MPIYVYRCDACGAEQEHIHKYQDAPDEPCSTCGAESGKLVRQMSLGTFRLQPGIGWDGWDKAKQPGMVTRTIPASRAPD